MKLGQTSILLLFMVPYLLFGAGESVLDKTAAFYKKKYKVTNDSFVKDRRVLDKLYQAYTIKLAKEQIVELGKIKRDDTKLGDIKGAISARDQIRLLNNAIKGNIETIDISPMSPKVSKSMNGYTDKVSQAEEIYESKKRKRVETQRITLAKLVTAQLTYLDRLEKVLTKKGELESIIVLRTIKENLRSKLTILSNPLKDDDPLLADPPALRQKVPISTDKSKHPINPKSIVIKMSANKVPPLIDGEDIANLTDPVTKKDKFFMKTGHLGQIFKTGKENVYLNAITFRMATGSKHKGLPFKTYVVRVSKFSDETLSLISKGTVIQDFIWGLEEYMTWTFSRGVYLSANTTYAFDIKMTQSTSDWKTGLPYISLTANEYSGGVSYHIMPQKSEEIYNPYKPVLRSKEDRIFHLDLDKAK